MWLPDKQKPDESASKWRFVKKFCWIILLILVMLVAILGITTAVQYAIKDSDSSTSSTKTGKQISPDEEEAPDTLHRWPWAAAVMQAGLQEPCCTGVLLSDRHVLTAAHCVEVCKRQNSSLTVRLGGNKAGEDAQSYVVKSYKKHEGYGDKYSGVHDIAVLELEAAVQFTDHVQTASLTKTDEPYDSQEFIHAGHGARGLEELPMQVWHTKLCHAAIDSRERHAVLDSFLCSTSESEGKLLHDISSGGPLHGQASSGEWEVVGIAAFKTHRRRSLITTYIKVYKYLPWIEQTLKDSQGLSEIQASNDDERKIVPRSISEEKKSSIPSHWTWTAAIQNHGRTCCGGVLLATGKHVLTAAHCVDARGTCGSKTGSLSVRLPGSKDESDYKEYSVSLVKQHKDFSYENIGAHDIAILELETSVLFNDFVQPASLALDGASFYSKRAVVTGFQETKLQEMPVRVWNSEKCRGVVDSATRRSIVDYFLCSSSQDSRKAVKAGHGGGPLNVQAPTGEWHVAGIVSFQINRHPFTPTVYVKIDEYLHWIHETIDNFDF